MEGVNVFRFNKDFNAERIWVAMGEIVDLILIDIKKEIVKSNKLLLEQLVKMNELLEKNNKLLDDINWNVKHST